MYVVLVPLSQVCAFDIHSLLIIENQNHNIWVSSSVTRLPFIFPFSKAGRSLLFWIVSALANMIIKVPDHHVYQTSGIRSFHSEVVCNQSAVASYPWAWEPEKVVVVKILLNTRQLFILTEHCVQIHKNFRNKKGIRNWQDFRNFDLSVQGVH